MVIASNKLGTGSKLELVVGSLSSKITGPSGLRFNGVFPIVGHLEFTSFNELHFFEKPKHEPTTMFHYFATVMQAFLVAEITCDWGDACSILLFNARKQFFNATESVLEKRSSLYWLLIDYQQSKI